MPAARKGVAIIAGMLAILRQRNFALLWTGGLISMIGDWVLIVGLPYEVYRRTGSTLATGAVALSFLIPSIALGSVAGIFVDRWDRRRLMVAVNLILAVVILPLLVIDTLGIWIAFVVLFASSSIDQLFNPAETALLPNLLEGGDEQLVTANALNGMNNQLARLLGPAVGGVIVAVGGISLVTAVDAVSFVVAAAMIAAIRSQRTRAERHESLEHEAATAWRRLIGEWREGLQVVLRHPVLRAVLVFLFITRIGEGLTVTLFVPWVTDALHSDAGGYGWLLSTQAMGGLVGAVVIGRMGARLNALSLLIGGGLAFGLIDLVLFTYPVVYPFIGPALVGMVIVGVPGSAMMTGRTTLQQTLAPDALRGRVVGAMMAISAFGSLIGAIGAGLLGEVLPVVGLLVVQGSGYVVASLTVAWLTRGDRARAAAGVV